MEKRLRLAKNLLKNTGVIFISIDDNEQANLRLLCDDIFYDKNFITNFIWRKTKTPPRLSKNVARVHDYILCYGKNVNFTQLKKTPLSKEYIERTYKNPDNDPRGPWRLVPLLQPDSSKNREFVLEMPDGRKIKGKWRCSKETFEQYIKDDLLVVSRGGKPNRKRFLSEVEGQIVDTWIDDCATNEDGSNEMKNLFGTNSVFSSPKPVELIRFLIGTGNKNSKILDFMAGSGTTGHATLQLNKEDGGRRQFILCTNNENKIAEEVTYSRIKKIIEGYNKDGNGEEVDGLGGGLEYFKTDFINVDVNLISDEDKLNISKKIGYILGIRHNCFEEKKLNNHYHILENKKENVFIYFEEDLSKFTEFREYMKGKNGTMYSYSGGSKKRYDMNEKEFKNIKMEKIPEKFIAVYKNCIS